MSVRPLPVRPNLDQLKRQAKDLLRGIHACDPEALAELKENHPNSINPSSEGIALVLEKHLRRDPSLLGRTFHRAVAGARSGSKRASLALEAASLGTRGDSASRVSRRDGTVLGAPIPRADLCQRTGNAVN
jgi:hypothetical protein